MHFYIFLYQKSLRYQYHRKNYQTSLLEPLIPSGLRIIKRPAINAISDLFQGQWNVFLCDAEEKLAQLLLKESESIFTGIETQIETETSNDYEEKHLKFRQQLENRQAKK